MARPRAPAPQPDSVTARPKNSAATREAILASGRKAFARAGYDGVGVREIAAGAGVTAMLINRYFGSKQKLYAEVVASTIAQPVILTRDTLEAPNRAELIALKLVAITRPGEVPLDGFPIMHHATSGEAVDIGRDQIEQHHYSTLLNALSGASAPERAGLALALVAGVQMMRQRMRLNALADADEETLVRLLTPLVHQLLDPPS